MCNRVDVDRAGRHSEEEIGACGRFLLVDLHVIAVVAQKLRRYFF